MPEKAWEPESLREAVRRDMSGAGVEQPGDTELQRTLERVGDPNGEINGVAYTTSGAYSVRGTGAPGLTTLTERDGQVGSREQEIDLDTVSEPRLWQVIDKKIDDGGNVTDENSILAHGLQWLNGSEAAEIVVGASREGLPGGSDCRARESSYP